MELLLLDFEHNKQKQKKRKHFPVLSVFSLYSVIQGLHSAMNWGDKIIIATDLWLFHCYVDVATTTASAAILFHPNNTKLNRVRKI